MGPFSLTGQPNAMGGREVGGLANQLAAHMGFTPAEIDRVRRFWNAPRMAEREGLKAVQMFEAIERGEIKALWVMATNPAVSLPRAGAVREALEQARSVRRLGERAVERHRRMPARMCCCRPPPGARRTAPSPIRSAASRASARSCRCRARRKPDWWIVTEVARRMGFAEAFAYRSAADIFREHAALSAFENDGTRDFDLGGLAQICDDDFDALAPVQWPLPRRRDAPAERALLRRRRLLHARPQGALHRARAAALQRSDVGRISAAAQHRPRARPVAHHDAHRHEPAARRASAGAVRRGASGRRRRGRSRRRRLRARLDRAWRLRRSRSSSATASGRARCSCRSTGATRPPRARASAIWCRPRTDPFSGQPEAKATPAAIAPVDFAAARLRPQPRPISRCRPAPGGRA